MTFVVVLCFSVAIYCLVLALLPKKAFKKTTDYTQGKLLSLESDAPVVSEQQDTSILRAGGQNSPITRLFFLLPGTKGFYPTMLKAGMAQEIERFFIVQLTIFAVLNYVLARAGFIGIGVALAATYGIGYMRVKSRIRRRNAAFLASFPDALDMIVRSVRSGYPLNSAIRMVADNMQPPVSTEFKQVADETAYGSSLIESLSRLAQRVDEPDVRFFVVMLTVQQDVGGNLSESLSNLSGILRKRRQLRLKVRAMTSEGRATAYTLGALPPGLFGIIWFIQPNHLMPLFTTHTGNIMLGVAIGILLLGATIVWRLVNPEI